MSARNVGLRSAMHAATCAGDGDQPQPAVVRRGVAPDEAAALQLGDERGRVGGIDAERAGEVFDRQRAAGGEQPQDLGLARGEAEIARAGLERAAELAHERSHEGGDLVTECLPLLILGCRRGDIC